MRHRLNPNFSSVSRDNPFRNGESNASSQILFPGMQPLKDAEDFLLVFLFKANSVIGDTEDPSVGLAFGLDVDFWLLQASILNRVRNQILKHLSKLPADGPQGW